MKKIIVLCSVFLLAFGLVSCDFGDEDFAPRDKWCMKSIEVSDYEFDCYFLYTENGYEHNNLNSESFSGKRINPGLIIVLKPYVDGIVGDLTSSTYFYKFFPIESSIESEKSTVKVNNFLWNALWISNSISFSKNGIAENPPTFLKSNGKIDFLDSFEDLSWKDILIALIEGI